MIELLKIKRKIRKNEFLFKMTLTICMLIVVQNMKFQIKSQIKSNLPQEIIQKFSYFIISECYKYETESHCFISVYFIRRSSLACTRLVHKVCIINLVCCLSLFIYNPKLRYNIHLI